MDSKNTGKLKGYFEHPGRVIETDEKFKLVMAITLDPRTNYHEGILRCITSRDGEPGTKVSLDRSELRIVRGTSLERFGIGEPLEIMDAKKVIEPLVPPGADFIGLEDPDIWIDEKKDLMHVYFTIPVIAPENGDTINRSVWSLGHAVGKDLYSLTMTAPVLTAKDIGTRAKEVSIAPINKQGIRLNLFESHVQYGETGHSTVRVAIAEDMGASWRYGETVFNPANEDISWANRSASPGPLLPREFMDIGEGKLLGILNGCGALRISKDNPYYGIWSIGLFIYDYERGKIDWVSPKPFIWDSEAKSITFASQFVEQGKGSGILYAHVDDSFVRAYTLNAEEIKKLLP